MTPVLRELHWLPVRQRIMFKTAVMVYKSHRLTTYGRRAFSVAGPMFWNSLPRSLRDPS